MTNEEKLKKIPHLLEMACDMAICNTFELARGIATIKKLIVKRAELEGLKMDETCEQIDEHINRCIYVIERQLKEVKEVLGE
jgi:hypothetical protein